MRKVQLLLVCLALSVAASAADKVVKLPKPNLNRTGTVMKALSERQSTREYASKALSLADLSDLLWAANGINRPESGKRTAPSALNKQDVDVYVILPEGSYVYDAKNHQLNLVSEGDHRDAVAGGQTLQKWLRYLWCWLVMFPSLAMLRNHKIRWLELWTLVSFRRISLYSVLMPNWLQCREVRWMPLS